ncbi:hypothetical protein B9Z55_009961 [Caenorhabditis nigoni]|uniref:Uncharacterized protein n=2 Tax=Caenorhabditis nigoni TaxID=1611254 RepID=A0A2G5UU93_9PELO|nr:hypothetical protein B9Z55_009961 [Caenorhabditis nigoni]
MYGNAEKSPMNWIAWSFGLFLIAIILIVSFYMFVMYLKSQHQKNQKHDEDIRIEEEKMYRDRLAAINSQKSSGVSTVTGSVREIDPKSEKSSENTEKTETSSKVEGYLVKKNDETKAPAAVIVLEKEPKEVPAPKISSKEPSTEELSSKKSLTDLKPIGAAKIESPKTANGEVSVEIPKPPSTLPTEKRIFSAEKVPESSLGSDYSTYVISSQRSEMNNYNMLEAGRTPPTFSNSENPLQRTSSIESFVPHSTMASTIVGTPPTAIPAKQNSETLVSMTTPPIKK